MTKFLTIVRRAVTAASIAAAGGALTSTPAIADTVVSTQSVSFADLDLSTPAGQTTMQRRMRTAARQVCGYNASERDPGQAAEQNACIARAMGGAQTSLALATTRLNSGQQVAIGGMVQRNVPGRAR